MKAVLGAIDVFQPTLPQRERLERSHCFLRCPIFQPTLPQRERHEAVMETMFITEISTHAPTKGATAAGRHYSGRPRHFNPRSHKGSDRRLP